MKASVVLEMTVVVESSEAWGKDCTIGHAHQQAVDSAKKRLSRLIGGEIGMTVCGCASSRVVITARETDK